MTITFGEGRVGKVATEHILDCIKRDWVTAGPKVKQFEKEWGQLFDYKHNCAMSSGTDAVLNLVASLYDFGAQPGDEVIVPALSFIATANAVRMAGFTPVFVDIECETLNINAGKVGEAITDKTRAILCVHTMGRMCDMAKLRDIADRHELLLFEDACEAHGASTTIYKGDTAYPHYVGTIGDGAAFSFYAAHLVFASEGGMVSTSNEKIWESVASTKSHGRKPGDLYFNHERFGFNSKMTDLAASIGLEGVGQFWDTFKTRHHNMQEIKKGLADLRDIAWFSEEDPNSTNCAHGFSITFKPGHTSKLPELCYLLDQAKIQWKRNFGCIPNHGAFSYLGFSEPDCCEKWPNAMYCGNYGIHVGLHQYLSRGDIRHMIETFRRVL